MASIKKSSDPLESFSEDQIAEIIKSNDALDQEQEKLIREQEEEKTRKELENKSQRKFFRRLKRSPLEILNRSLFFVFIGNFLFSFVSVYASSPWWFLLYVISAFSSILYIPNRKALKELIAAWPNIEDVIKNRSLWK